MAVQSIANRVQIEHTYTTSSPLSVPLSSVGSSLVITVMVRNVGVSQFMVRGKVASTATGWTNLAENEEAVIVLEGTAAEAVSLEFARRGKNPRYISMYDTVTQDIPGQAQIERNV